jgi:lipoprotein-anchoring transpeptidase ErfK/SrfK
MRNKMGLFGLGVPSGRMRTAGSGKRLSTVLLGATLCGAILVLASCGQPVPFTHVPFAQAFTFGRPAPTPVAPSSVYAQTANTDSALKPGAWTNSPRVQLGAARPAGAANPLVLEAEFQPEQQPLVGMPNVIGQPGEETVVSPEMDAGQTYRWALRLRNPGGSASTWVRFPGTIGYQPTPPAAPAIHPLAHDGWSSSRQLQVAWDAEGDPAGITGYAYSLDQSAPGALPVRIDGSAQTASFTVPRDGDWYVHVRTIDGAGNPSPIATLPFHVDTAALSLQPPTFAVDGSWNPALGPLPIQVKSSKAAQMALSILPENSTVPVRTFKLDGKADATVQWDGNDDRGQSVPAGSYRVRLDAGDKTGRSARAIAQDLIPLTNKRIIVSLSQERMVAYEGDKVFVDTLVTTGGPELPTPLGTFHILEKRSPFTFKSPWPKGSPYWYEDSPTTYAMLFENSGYFIHDAPWRSWFGPGSNVVDGKPGGDGTGTHGCVNVPFGVQSKLYRWTDAGTPVLVIDKPIS